MDETGFCRWIGRLALAVRRPADTYDSEDISQEVCLEFSRSTVSIRDGTLEHAKPWARQVLDTKIVDYRRYVKQAKRDPSCERRMDGAGFAGRLADLGPSASSIAEQHEFAAILQGAMKLLTRGQREIVRLHHLEGLTFAEIAELMDISTASVSGLNTRALRAMSKIVPSPVGGI